MIVPADFVTDESLRLWRGHRMRSVTRTKRFLVGRGAGTKVHLTSWQCGDSSPVLVSDFAGIVRVPERFLLFWTCLEKRRIAL